MGHRDGRRAKQRRVPLDPDVASVIDVYLIAEPNALSRPVPGCSWWPSLTCTVLVPRDVLAETGFRGRVTDPFLPKIEAPQV